MNELIGLLAKSYVSSTLISSGNNITWIEIDIASEETGSDERNEAVVKDRRSQYEKYIYGQRAVGQELTATFVKGDNTLSMIRNAYTNNDPIAFASVTGNIATNAEEGWMFDAFIMQMGRPQPFEDVWTVSLMFKPAPLVGDNNAGEVEFFVVGA